MLTVRVDPVLAHPVLIIKESNFNAQNGSNFSHSLSILNPSTGTHGQATWTTGGSHLTACCWSLVGATSVEALVSSRVDMKVLWLFYLVSSLAPQVLYSSRSSLMDMIRPIHPTRKAPKAHHLLHFSTPDDPSSQHKTMCWYRVFFTGPTL